MTPLDLQELLVEELTELFQDYNYKKPTEQSVDESELELDLDDDSDGETDTEDEDTDTDTDTGTEEETVCERVPINVFAQDIPVLESGNETDPVPYIIVRLSSGSDSGEQESFNTVSLIIIIGIWDDALDQQGYRDVMNIIQKIYHRFHVNPSLKGRALYTGAFHWAMQEDGYFPYFFGACNLNFYIPAIRREDKFV